MDLETMKRIYIIGTLIVFLGLIAAVTILLHGTDYLTPIYLILAGSIVWFLLIVPRTLFTELNR